MIMLNITNYTELNHFRILQILLLGLKYEELSWDLAKPSATDDPDCLPCIFIQVNKKLKNFDQAPPSEIGHKNAFIETFSTWKGSERTWALLKSVYQLKNPFSLLYFHQMTELILWISIFKKQIHFNGRFNFVTVWCRWKWNAHIENGASIFKASPNDGCLNITLCRANATPKIGWKWTTTRKCGWR